MKREPGLTIVNTERWTEQAVCASTDPELLFPDKGDHNVNARRVCYSCPVRSDCLRYALDTDQRYGIWGGLSAWERARPRRWAA